MRFSGFLGLQGVLRVGFKVGCVSTGLWAVGVFILLFLLILV